MDLEQVTETVESFWNDTGRAVVQVLLLMLPVAGVLAIAAITARFVRRRVGKRLQRPDFDRNLAVLFTNLAVIAIYLLAFSLILALFGATWSSFLTVIGAGTIVIGLSLQDLLKSYVAGVYILLERPFRVGDRIRVKEVDGVVEGVELRTTMIRTDNGELVTVPNATVFLEIVTNRSTSQHDRTTVVLSKIELPLPQIMPNVTTALSGLSGLEGTLERPPRIDLVSSTADGATVSVTAFHPVGTDVQAEMLARLRAHFPAADLAVERT
jgi:small-conductance mechanosensitive channel